MSTGPVLPGLFFYSGFTGVKARLDAIALLRVDNPVIHVQYEYANVGERTLGDVLQCFLAHGITNRTISATPKSGH